MYFLIGIRVDVSDKKWWGPVPTSLFVPAALVIIARFCALAVLRDHTRDGGNSAKIWVRPTWLPASAIPAYRMFQFNLCITVLSTYFLCNTNIHINFHWTRTKYFDQTNVDQPNSLVNQNKQYVSAMLHNLRNKYPILK